MVDILKLRLKDIDNFNSSGDNFDVKLKNGAGCSFIQPLWIKIQRLRESIGC